MNPSMHRLPLALAPFRRFPVGLIAQPMKDGQDGALGRVDERPLCDVRGALEQLFSLSHGGVRNWDTHSLHKAAFSGIPFNLNGVEAA